MENIQKRPFILSGGGARGFAHVGVLQALEESGIFPSEIAATSAGALVGAFVADGFTAGEIKEMVLKNINFRMLFGWESVGLGIVTLKKIGDFMKSNLRHQHIEDLPIPYYPTATDFRNGHQHVFRSGDIVKAALAASSIPAVFAPTIVNHIPYVDGAVCNNLPHEPLEGRLKDAVAVNVNPLAPYDGKDSIARILDRAFHMSIADRVRKSTESCWMFIEPQNLYHYGIFDAHKLPEIYEVGYTHTKQLLLI